MAETGFFRGFTDWHCHILPGVDDGVETTEESLAILRLYEQSGIGAVWLTPHIMEDIPNETSALRERFKALQAAYAGPVELHLAAENMLDTKSVWRGTICFLWAKRETIFWWRPPISTRRWGCPAC